MNRKTLDDYVVDFQNVAEKELLSAIETAYPQWHPGMQQQIHARLIKRRVQERADAERDRINTALQAAGIKLDSVDYAGDGSFVISVRDIVSIKAAAVLE